MLESTTHIDQLHQSQLPQDLRDLFALAVLHYPDWSLKDLILEEPSLTASVMGVSTAEVCRLIDAIKELIGSGK